MTARRNVLFLLLAAVLSACGPSQAPRTMMSWNALKDGTPKTYTIDGYALTFSVREDEGDKTPLLHAKAPTGEEIDVSGVAGFSDISANFGIGKLDAGSTTEQVILSTFSGGAHCCTDVKVLTLTGGGWKTVEFGAWDGDGLSAFPADIDGDGYADFVFSDDRFAYAFTDYADSYMPPRIFQIHGTEAMEFSQSKSFHMLFEKDMHEAEGGCIKHNNGACAAYAADAARLGQFDRAWDMVLKNYDPKSDWIYPTKCNAAVGESGRCPKDQEVKFANFPDALMWFLADTGYIAAK